MEEKPEKVEIVYITQDYVSRFGAEPVPVPPKLAKKYENLGVAKLLVRKPVGNVLVKKEEMEEEEFYVPEEEHLTKVAWITGEEPENAKLKSVGELSGFKIDLVRGLSFSPGKLYKAKVIILSSNLSGFNDYQKLQLKSMLFQRRIPFVYFVENDYDNFLWEKFCLIRSTLNVFTKKRIMERAIDNYGDAISKSILFDGKDLFNFWREIDSIL